ncbi:helix-turn-helix transcriptional regulator [Flavobacterium sp. WC2429]|uniref:Helix-turn-helix transcriptional regulator n=1 Tax=Flavobacterium sp. WC2429 TaxID=3234140 RepID=A0AB39WGE1_9FLAO
MDAIIGNNIKLLRDKISLTQGDLADFLGLSRMQIIRYENGTTPVSTDNLTKLAELFSVDEYDFYEEDTAKINTNLAFAFRANELKVEDLKTIASFKKIAMNYLKMKESICNE